MRENIVQDVKEEQKDTEYLVMVYGSLKKNFHNHHLLHTSELLGEQKTAEEYTMYGLGGFPAIKEGGSTSICGEVYKVDDPTFKRLDRLEGYPHFYNRKEIETSYGTAWIYYIKDADSLKSNKVIESGIWER